MISKHFRHQTTVVVLLLISVFVANVAAQTKPEKPRVTVTPSKAKLLPKTVGRFKQLLGSMDDIDTIGLKRAFVSLGATKFYRAIYQVPNNITDRAIVYDGIAVLTIALFPSQKKAESALSVTSAILGAKGYSIKPVKLLKKGVAESDEQTAEDTKNKDWLVIWTNGKILLQVQSPNNLNDAMEFSKSYPF